MNQYPCTCTNHRTPVMGKYTCLAYVRGNVAYALDALPHTHVEITTGTPWAQSTIYLCGTHHAQFINRKAININTPSKEDTMNINATITNNEIVENNLPSSTVTGSSDRGDKWIKCVKCSKEIGSDWYHGNVTDLRTCMAAAPRPVKMAFKTDLATGETSTNTDLKFFYDASKVVVFNKARYLRTQGYFVMKVAKATNGNKDWYVQYKENNR